MKIIKSLALFWTSRSSVKSLSLQPTNLQFLFKENHKPKSIVPLIYRRILFSTLTWVMVRFSMCQLMNPVAYKMLGLVLVRYCKLPTKLLKSVASTISALSHFDNFNPHSISMLTGMQPSILNLCWAAREIISLILSKRAIGANTLRNQSQHFNY
jgi:hypothetical protein